MELLISQSDHREILIDAIIDEIAYAAGLKKKGWMRNLLSPFLFAPAKKLATVFADFYYGVVTKGTMAGATEMLPKFNVQVKATGVEKIPKTGSHLLIANHPGGLDSAGILSCIARRDIKFLVSDVQLLRKLDYLNRHSIYVDFRTIGGMSALRSSIAHLQQGGLVLMFPRGEVEPDPACFPGAVEAIDKWSSSIEVMLRKSPSTKVQVITVSGAILPTFALHPLTRIRKKLETREKLAEAMQMVTALYKPEKTKTMLNIRFSDVVNIKSINRELIMPFITDYAKAEMRAHISAI